MKYSHPLIKGQLIKRYKRFLADVQLANSETITVHCPNTGSMKNCAEPGFTVYLSDSNNPKRKYRHTWELAQNHQGQWIGINTHQANTLIQEAIEAGLVEELADFDQLKREVKYGQENSKIDILVSKNKHEHFIEVKSVTLCEHDIENSMLDNESAGDNENASNKKRIGYFPDAVSTRGQKHLRELIEVAGNDGQSAWLVFCVQHSGIETVRPAKHIDPAYAELLQTASDAGVKIIALKSHMSDVDNCIVQSIPVEIGR